jgi:predicted RND superfamily exporter protein
VTAGLAAILYRWRFPLTALIILGALALADRAQITRIDNDLTAWFDKADPVYRDYERLRHEFTGSRTLILALAGDSVLSAAGLDGIRRAVAEIERLPVVTRVYSLATANRVTAAAVAGDEGGIEVQPLVPRAGPIDAAAVKAHALGDPLIVGDLVSKDGRVTAILINFDEDRIEAVRGDTIDRIRAIVTKYAPSGARVHLNGSIEISETYNRVTIANTEKFTPPILLFTCLALYAMFRSWRTMLLTLAAVGVSVLWTLGLYSLMGFTFNVLSSMLVPLIVVLAIADDVHIVQHYTEALRESGDRAHAFRTSVSALALPLFAASGTTALGMLSLATSDVHAVRAFGIGSAVGVMVDCVISLVFVPTLLTLIKVDVAPPPQERWLLGPLERVSRFSCRRPGLVMTVAGLVAVAAMAGIARLRIDTNHINFFAPRHPLSISANLIDRSLSGVYTFQVFFEGPPESMKNPALLARMKHLGEALGGLPNVRKVISIVDYVERVNRTLHDDDPRAAVVPESPELVAQELLLFSLSDGGREELAHVVSSDFSRAQMTVRLASMSSDVVFEQILEAQRMAERTFAGSGVTATVTGSGRLFAQLDHYLVTSQLSSFATAFVTVFAVIFIVFRSFRFGMLAIVPNLFPVLAVLGLMGWLDISMNVATVMLASVALGVVDDDTIHFISRYRREAAAGGDTDGAILAATRHEARASATTMVINSCAYAVLVVSDYRPTAWFGGLLALTMAVAFLAEVFILPATIKLVPRWFAAEKLRARARVTLEPAGAP